MQSFYINEYFVIKESLKDLSEHQTIKPTVEKSLIGFVFYKKGDVLIDIKNGSKTQTSHKKSGIASSFYISNEANVTHHVLSNSDLEKITIFLPPEKLLELIDGQEIHFQHYFKNLVTPDAPFIQGKNFASSLEMDTAMSNIFQPNKYTGIVQNLFIESQINELMFAYFNRIEFDAKKSSKLSKSDIEKIYYVRELILSDLEAPLTLNSLARQSLLNEFKLKSGFKELFGMPVYQYILHKRLEKAHHYIINRGYSIQEAALLVGYSSLGSFSNAFLKKFGYRPSNLRG
ncbi:helix-turn-helix transcriptional regulator [Fulvivirga lutea]|uniref:Helix-turn-helix transcriptional regulator n=1 Tax=Fulvivirga lutea TaxID=2810512 RepID=A0A975A2C6_9BACT|nr:AraC family transcriptional regulator [Fulvivirga lutea]QSE98696.1 helix-turn-helix transcriptional regulator [Fulvivirga lutea]